MKLEAAWLVGFVDGEGCFHVGIAKHPGIQAGCQILPEFTIVQHERDVQLLHAIKAYFGCGVVRRNHGDRMAYRVRRLEHLHDVICPFFMKHKLRSRKHVDFLKFRHVVRKMKNGDHLTPDGGEEIRRIAAEMNVRRSR